MPAPKDPEKYKLWRERLKAAKVDFVPWNKGRKISEESEFDEYRENMSKAHKGKPRPELRGRKTSEETKEKLSKKLKGRRVGFADGHKHSEETKAKMSESHKGIPHAPLSEEQRLQISESLKQAYIDHPEMKEHLHNREVSDETRQKISEGNKTFNATERGQELIRQRNAATSARQSGKSMPDETRQKISESNKEKFSDTDVRAEIGERSKALWENEEFRSAMLEALNSEESKKKRSEAGKRNWDNLPEEVKEERRRLASERMKARWNDPESRQVLLDANASSESRQKKSEAVREHWDDPTIGPKMLEAVLRNSDLGNKKRYKIGYHYSPKTGENHHHRSAYELAAYKKLDADPNCVLYITEPCVIPYIKNGRTHRYTPDLYVEFSDGSWALIEIKPGFQLDDEETQTKHLAASVKYDEHFMIWSEQELVA